MKNIQALVTISLDEYNDLQDDYQQIKKMLNSKKTIIFHDAYFGGHGGYPVHKFVIINPTKLMVDLGERMDRIMEENSRLRNEIEKIKKQSIWKICMYRWRNALK